MIKQSNQIYKNLNLSIDIINQLRPVTYNYKNKNKYGSALRYGLIAQEIKNIIPSLVNYSYGVIDNTTSEFNITDINIYNDKVTLQLNTLDIKQGDKLEISDIDNDGMTSNIRTIDIIEVSDNNFSFIDSKINTNKSLYIW